MINFAAIDFETANKSGSSVCAVGIVIVKNGEITNKFYSLIQPEPNYYNYWNTRVHGLTAEDTDNAQVFPFVWEKIESLIGDLPLVAHNSKFDETCLKEVFKVYQMDYPDYRFYCTVKASRKHFPELENHQLHTVSRHCGYEMVAHHEALDDAYACAIIGIKIFGDTLLFM
jgi:DNA polymerase-3 subunit epsilon